MKHDDEHPLAEDMPPSVDQARLARQWSAVSEGLAARPRKRFLLASLAPAVLIALATIAVLIARPWRTTATGAPALAAYAPDALVLPDGSHVALSSGAEVVLESATRERVHLILAAGSVDLDVTHVDGRPFVVTAAGHDVTVLGTAFSVKLAGVSGQRTLSVAVSRGRVRVTGPTGEHVLDAGQAWSVRVDEAQAISATAAVPEDTTSSAARESAAPAATAAEPSSRPAASAASLGSTASSGPTAAAIPVEGPRELLARATDARTAGRPRDAAVALDTLRKRHRSDARAGLAAFELGRVRMDALHDPAGAAEAFADAIALAPSAPFREDAEARRVEALDALPDRARCERVRDAYLAHYPTGLHAKQIAQRCKRP